MNWDKLKLKLNHWNHIRCEVGWDLPRAFSDNLSDYDLWFVWAGQGQMQLHGGEVQLHAGMCIWMRPGGVYDAQQDLTNRLGVSAQHFDLCDIKTGQRPRDKDLPPEVVYMPDTPAVTSTMRTIARLYQVTLTAKTQQAREAKHVAEQLMRGLLMEVCYQSQLTTQRLTPAQHLHRSVITQMAADMHAAPQDMPSIEALADQAGYTPAHFSRVFKDIMGVSPQQYLIQAKIDRATQLLHETDWSMSRIAQVLGYNDVFFFSRQFKSVTGQTPSAVRRS